MHNIIDWLLQGDVAIQYHTRRYLLQNGQPVLEPLRERIANEGWGKRFLQQRRVDGHWGMGAYQPKWICTHYTLQDLMTIGISPRNRACGQSVALLLGSEPGCDGGVNFAKTVPYSDVCINGMLLNFAGYFLLPQDDLTGVIDYLLARAMPDGGWNCEYYRGARHSSFHTTINVLEGLTTFKNCGGQYRRQEITAAICNGVEFLLAHRLYRSHRSGEVVDPNMLHLPFPFRWRYNILRALELMCDLGMPYDPRMQDAVETLEQKRLGDGRWRLPQRSARGYLRRPGIYNPLAKPGLKLRLLPV